MSRRPLLLLVWLAALWLLASCAPSHDAASQPLPTVDLSVRTALPQAAEAEITPLRLGVAAIISPVGTVESYDALARSLGDNLGRPVELVQRRTYSEMNDLIEAMAVDVAFSSAPAPTWKGTTASAWSCWWRRRSTATRSTTPT